MTKTPRSPDAISKQEIKERLVSAHQKGSVGFITELLAIEQMLPYGDQGFIEAASEYVNERAADIFQIASDAIASGQDVFRIAHIVPIFPLIELIEATSLLSFLRIYDEKTENDMMSGQLFEPVRKRASLQKDWARNLESVILEKEQKRFYSYLLAIYLGFSDSDLSFGYGKIKTAYTSEVPELRGIGLRGIAILPKLSDEEKQESFKVLILSADSSDEAVACNSAFSIARLHSESEDLNRKRIELSKTSVPAVRFEILRQIQFKQGTLTPDDIQIVKNLCVYDLSLKGISDSLDNIIYFLITKGEADAVRDILNTWVASHSFEEHVSCNFPEIFDSSAFEMLKNRDLMQRLITDWFNADDSRFHHVLQEVISYMGVHGTKTIALEPAAVSSWTDDDVLYVVRKVLGFVHDFDISISLILSILDREILSGKTAGVIRSVLVEHIGDNYLVRTIDRLNSEIQNAVAGSTKFKTLSDALQRLQEKLSAKSALSRRDELMPNAAHEAELNRAFHKSMNASMKEARKKSVLGNLFSQITVRDALSTFSYTHGEFRPPSKMGSFSHGIELPKKDVLDEVGASFERAGFRLAKRGEQ
ncbi:MAG: hypothetical protein IPL83_02525 [Bdellovibrionales bacterium]|nr:hypothetical protein [Bdellovibrionales bacterium]